MSRIQVNPGIRIEHYALPGHATCRIHAHQLSATQTTIYGFNANGYAPNGQDQTQMSDWGFEI